MVIIKINSGTQQEREVEIVDEKGTWQSGTYQLFAAHFLQEDNPTPEPHNSNSLAYLGDLSVNKENESWNYSGTKLNAGEQKEIADFILDYQAPDGVY